MIISERLANRHRHPCAERVTWTRQYTMTQDEKTLILLVLLRMMPQEIIGANSGTKKPANALALG